MQRTTQTVETPSRVIVLDEPTPSRGPGPGGRSTAAIAIAVAIAALTTGVYLLVGENDRQPAISAQDPLELSLGQDDALASCLPFEVAILADMSPAFAATATGVDGDTVTLSVDRWFTGGDAESVVLHAPAGMEALIAGFDLEVGERYLLTASNGTVNYCGYSGPATPEFEAAFEQAFAA